MLINEMMINDINNFKWLFEENFYTIWTNL